MKTLLLTLIVLGSGSSFAQSTGTAPAGKTHPCQQVKSACESAGFVKGDHKDKKGLYKDCMQPLMAGQSVAGVSVGADVISACKAKKAEHGK
jgi:hypothetical protein